MGDRIAILGPGAIGGICAALMTLGGLDVTLVCKHPETAELASGRGLHITGFRGEHTVPVKAVATPDELDGTYSLVLIATKAYDLSDAACSMRPHMDADSLAVAMQNGICVDIMADAVGPERTVGCVIGWGATMHDRCELEMTSGGDFVIGLMQGCESPRLDSLRRALEFVAPCRVSGDIYAELYSKLIVNSCITSLGAVCGLTLGEMMKRRDARTIFLAIIAEAVEVAGAMKLDIPPYGGKLNYASLMKGSSPLDNLRRHAVIRIVGMKYSKLKSSSLQSLERGRPTEIDSFNGYIARKGKELGVACPVCERLTAMVREIEAGKRRISTDNLADRELTAALRR